MRPVIKRKILKVTIGEKILYTMKWTWYWTYLKLHKQKGSATISSTKRKIQANPQISKL